MPLEGLPGSSTLGGCLLLITVSGMGCPVLDDIVRETGTDDAAAIQEE
jgi:hypothetical protein